MVESVLAQDFDNWELLLVNDGAEVGIVEAMRQYVEADDRINLIDRHRPPKGAQTCRNIGLENASGELICFFDSDDLLLPYCLGNRVRFMDNNQDLDFAVFKAHTYDPTGKIHKYALGAKGTSDDIKYFIDGFLPFAVWTNIYRRESLLKCHAAWDEHLLSLQDSDFNIQNIVVNKLKYAYGGGEEPDYLWRKNCSVGSITSRIQSKEHNQSHLYFISKMIQSTRAEYGCKYDGDIALRIHDFCLKFAKNSCFDLLNQLQRLCLENKIAFGSVNRYKVYAFLISHGVMEKFLKLLLFPIETCRYRRNMKQLEIEARRNIS